MEVFAAIIYFSTAILTMLLGSIVILNNHRKKSNIVFFLFCFFVSIWIVLLYTALFSPLFGVSSNVTLVLGRLTYASSIIFPIFLPLFFYYFPRQRFVAPKIVFVVLAIIYLTLISITAFTPLLLKEQIIENGIWVADILGPCQLVYIIYIVLQMAFGLALAIYQLKNTTGIERQKIIAAASGFFIFYIFGMTFNVILPLFGIFLLQNEVVLFVLFFILPTFQAIQKYRFFEFTIFSLRVLRILFFFAVFIILSESILLVVESHFLGSQYDHFFNILAFFVGLMSFCFLTKKFPDFTTKELRDLRNSVAEVKILAYYCNDFSELQKLLEDNFVRKLHIVNTKIFVVRNQIENIAIPQYLENDFTRVIENHNEVPLNLNEVSESFDGTDKLVKQEMEKMEAELCFQLFAEGNLIGFWTMGARGKNIPWKKEEIDELSLLKNVLEVCMMNILIKSNLQRENNLMQNIIDEKTHELKSKIKDIKQLVNQQSDFIAVTAHEFRTPLSIALFQLEDVVESHELVKEVHDDLKNVEEALTNLQKLSQKLFDVHKYDLNKIVLKKSEIDLDDFLRKIYSNFKHSTDEKGLDFTYVNREKIKPKVTIDEDQIRQVLLNLLVNALKFTPVDQGKIDLILDEDEENIMIVVADNGKGIKDSDKETIFNKFRTDGSDELGKGRGIGLGLYICKKIIEAHNAVIGVRDNSPNGAYFFIKLSK